jgi:hypothetical protein
VDNPVDIPVDKCVYTKVVDNHPISPQLIHSLCTIFHTLYPQAQFDNHGSKTIVIHISTGPITTTIIF